MRKLNPLWVLLCAAACDLSQDPVVVEEAPNLEQRAVWTATLTGTPNYSGVNGTVTIRDFGSYLEAEASITGAPPGMALQWRIYNGTCAQPAAQFGPNQAYPNLTTDGAGAVSITRTLAGGLLLDWQYNVRVSTVATPVRIVACGDLQH